MKPVIYGDRIMIRRVLVLAAGISLAAVGMTAAYHDENHSGSVRTLAAREIVEKVDGKESTATAVEVTLEAGQAGTPHRHPGPVLGYVLEGEYEWAIDDQPAKVLKAGETFYEPAGCLHRVSRNPHKSKTRVLAWVIHPRNVRDLTIPEVKK
jgi:quercetin dioxygenase-like cupin family protein